MSDDEYIYEEEEIKLSNKFYLTKVQYIKLRSKSKPTKIPLFLEFFCFILEFFYKFFSYCFFLLLLLGQFCSSIYIAGVVKLLEQCVCLEVSKAVLEASIDGCGILRSVF